MKAFLHGEQLLSTERVGLRPEQVPARHRARQRVPARPPPRQHSARLESHGVRLALPRFRGSGRRSQPRPGASRSRLLVTADSLMVSLLEAGLMANRADSGWGGQLRRLFATLEHATGRVIPGPGGLGSCWVRRETTWGRAPGRPLRRAACMAFDKAIALDSAFAPSYLHPIERARPCRAPPR